MNIMKMMQKAKEMQEEMKNIQAKMAEIEVFGESGGGMIRVRMGGDRSLRQISIDPSLWADQDKALIEDLTVAAVNHAMAQVNEKSEQKKKDLLADLPLPPGFSL